MKRNKSYNENQTGTELETLKSFTKPTPDRMIVSEIDKGIENIELFIDTVKE